MSLAPFIATRYLFARKSLGVINVISAISAIGLAIGTAALVLILSVYNGFDGIIKENLSHTDPDLLIRRADGAVFVPEGAEFEALFNSPQASTISSVLSSNVFLMHEGKQAIAKAKGVDFVYEETSPVSGHVVSGKWGLHKGDLALAALGTQLASKLGANPRFLSPVEMYYPSTSAGFSPASPLSAVKKETLGVGSIISINADIDETLLIVPIETLASVLGCNEGEISGIELSFCDGLSARGQRRFIRETSALLGAEYQVLDRYRQNASLYRMMRYERAAIWAILVFVVLLVALNIFGSLSMLIIEKQQDIATLRALGASDSLVRKIFVFEGWMVSVLGMAAGLLIGVVLALIQQHFGIIKMPGSFLVTAYPVVLRLSDVLLSAAIIAALGLMVASAPARKAVAD